MRTKLIPLIILILLLSACGSTSQNSTPTQAHTQKSASVCTSTTSTQSDFTNPGAVSISTAIPAEVLSPSHMWMGPHMVMTAHRPITSTDINRANAIMQIARECLVKYKDYHLAERDGYQIFAEDVSQDIYHFANIRSFLEAQTRFDPLHPSALLYKKEGTDYQLVGIMFSAPGSYTEEQLNKIFPLSIAPWHLHVHICLPAGDEGTFLFQGNSPFGLSGTITTEAACTKAGGHFFPQLFGWMVHIYPFGESSQA